nr:hypothetical protein [uncultured bacterium]
MIECTALYKSNQIEEPMLQRSMAFTSAFRLGNKLQVSRLYHVVKRGMLGVS